MPFRVSIRGLPVALRSADWASALDLLKISDPPAAFQIFNFSHAELTQFSLGMQALDQHDLSAAEAASSAFDAELWRMSNHAEGRSGRQGQRKEKDDEKRSGPPKLK